MDQLKFAEAPSCLNIALTAKGTFFPAVTSKTKCLQACIDVIVFLVLVWGTRP
jgi:hypothetical protein